MSLETSSLSSSRDVLEPLWSDTTFMKKYGDSFKIYFAEVCQRNPQKLFGQIQQFARTMARCWQDIKQKADGKSWRNDRQKNAWKAEQRKKYFNHTFDAIVGEEYHYLHGLFGALIAKYKHLKPLFQQKVDIVHALERKPADHFGDMLYRQYSKDIVGKCLGMIQYEYETYGVSSGIIDEVLNKVYASDGIPFNAYYRDVWKRYIQEKSKQRSVSMPTSGYIV